jgi:hypothetical protein
MHCILPYALLKIRFHIFPKRGKNSYYKKLNVFIDPKVMQGFNSFYQLWMVKTVVLKCKASDMLLSLHNAECIL